ncbi:MAG: protein kinase, partial [Planctomycetota bacterium]
MTTPCPDRSTLRDFAAGLLPAEKEAAIAAHVDQCQICQEVLESLDFRGLALPSSMQPADQGSAVLATRLAQLKAESSIGGDASTKTKAPDLQPWLDKTTDQTGRQMVDEFELQECIGRGGMGVVFRALDTKLQRMVALKFMSPSLLANENAKERFFREAQAAAAIMHVNVVAVHSVNQFKELPYLVMELVPGDTLAHRIEAGRLPLDQVIAIGKQIALGLEAAHAVGVQHRDIKPTNILMDGKVAKLSDFGLARVAESDVRTGTGTLVGTPEFIAPERIEPKLGPSDHRSDLFSLGAVLYSMASGKSPFSGDSVLETLKSICVDQPAPLTSLVPDLPSWFSRLVSQLLSKRPEDRIQHSSEVVRILEQQAIATDLASDDRSDSPEVVLVEPAAARRFWPVLVGLGILVLAAGVFWAAYGRPGDEPEPKLAGLQGPTTSGEFAEPESVVDDEPEFIRVTNDEELAEIFGQESAGALAISLAGEEFRIPPVEIEQRDLTVVAAPGFRPTVFFSMNRNGNGFTATEVDLQLRGITLESDFDLEDELDLEELEALLVVDGGSLNLQACSIEHQAPNPCIMISDANATVSGCDVLAPNATAFLWQPSEEHRLEMEDNVVVSEIQFDLIEPFGEAVRLRENIFLGRHSFECGNDEGVHSLSMSTQDNTFVCSGAMLMLYGDESHSDSEGFDWLRWTSVADVLPMPLIQQVLERDDDTDKKRAWALIESLAEFENVSLDGSRQESEFLGSNVEEL